MRGIYHKELNQYFKTSIGYIFIAMFLVISGVYFFLVNLAPGNGDIKAFFSSIFTILMFLIPMLTMRLFSEERKQKTDELLLTSPVSITAVILGKFFSTMTVFLIPLSVTLLYPLILAAYGSFEPMAALGNYVGIILLSSSFVAIGLLISVLSESQLAAAVMTYAILLILFLAGSMDVLAGSAAFGWLVQFVSITGHYEEFTYGVFNPANVVYYVSVTSLFVFLSVYALERKRIA